MTDKKILQKLILKVKDKYTINFGLSTLDQIIKHKIYYKIIFDHEFQKALWGDLWINEEETPIVFNPKKGKVHLSLDGYLPAWMHHAKKMSIQPDYLKYLEKFI